LELAARILRKAYRYKNVFNQKIPQFKGLIEPRLVKTVGENSALPTYVVAVFDEEKKMLAYSVGESPQLASEDACRVALQKHLQKA